MPKTRWGGGEALTDKTQNNLVKELAKRPFAFSVLAYVNNEPAALINCFEAFSTFACQPLVNIHDVIVLEEFRGQSLSRKLFEQVEQIALERGCCKLTLEVLSENHIAKKAYQNFGFNGYELDPMLGQAQFWEKKLKSY